MEEKSPQDVDNFILEEIDSVPHLEALLLLWNSRPRPWPVQELARSLYISVQRTEEITRDLQRRGLIALSAADPSWNSACHCAALLPAVDRAWRQELVRISRMIHSKASPSVRQFAGAFRLKKSQNQAEKKPKKD